MQAISPEPVGGVALMQHSRAKKLLAMQTCRLWIQMAHRKNIWRPSRKQQSLIVRRDTELRQLMQCRFPPIQSDRTKQFATHCAPSTHRENDASESSVKLSRSATWKKVLVYTCMEIWLGINARLDTRGKDQPALSWVHVVTASLHSVTMVIINSSRTLQPRYPFLLRWHNARKLMAAVHYRHAEPRNVCQHHIHTPNLMGYYRILGP